MSISVESGCCAVHQNASKRQKFWSLIGGKETRNSLENKMLQHAQDDQYTFKPLK